MILLINRTKVDVTAMSIVAVADEFSHAKVMFIVDLRILSSSEPVKIPTSQAKNQACFNVSAHTVSSEYLMLAAIKFGSSQAKNSNIWLYLMAVVCIYEAFFTETRSNKAL